MNARSATTVAARLFRAGLLIAAMGAWLTPTYAQELGAEPAELLEGATQRLDAGRLISSNVDAETRQWVFYFGASWCGPCRAFMPDLVRAYEAWRAEKRSIELVFVSGDGSCSSMESYIQQMRMPWPVVACRKRDSLPSVRGLSDQALPGLVVVNQDGVVTDSSFWKEQYGRYQQVLAAIQ
ncbi:MAG: thioredoxin-like domain-containing protein [Pseudomonadota bacterium]